MADQGGGGENVARLDVVVQSPGATQAKSDAVGALSAITSAASTNATAIDSNTEAFQRWTDQQRETARQALIAERTTGDLTVAQKFLAQQSDEVRAALARVSGAAVAATEAAEEQEKAYKQVTDSSLAMGRAHM